jgi:competence protein ComGC
MNKSFTLIETLLIVFILTLMINLLIQYVQLDLQIEKHYVLEGEE